MAIPLQEQTWGEGGGEGGGGIQIRQTRHVDLAGDIRLSLLTEGSKRLTRLWL